MHETIQQAAATKPTPPGYFPWPPALHWLLGAANGLEVAHQHLGENMHQRLAELQEHLRDQHQTIEQLKHQNSRMEKANEAIQWCNTEIDNLRNSLSDHYEERQSLYTALRGLAETLDLDDLGEEPDANWINTSVAWAVTMYQRHSTCNTCYLCGLNQLPTAESTLESGDWDKVRLELDQLIQQEAETARRIKAIKKAYDLLFPKESNLATSTPEDNDGAEPEGNLRTVTAKDFSEALGMTHRDQKPASEESH